MTKKIYTRCRNTIKSLVEDGIKNTDSAKPELVAGIKTERLSRTHTLIKAAEAKKLSLCLGTGVSASINRCVNNRSYLWNGLVYGIAGEMLKEVMTRNDMYEEHKSYMMSVSYDKYSDLVTQLIDNIVEDSTFLSSENTMECVEYIKNMAQNFYTNCGVEDVYENILKLITDKLFNEKRRVEDDPVEKKIKDDISSSYSSPDSYKGYKSQKGETLIETALLLQKMECASVLTYNYDDYLETALDILGVDYAHESPILTSSDKRIKIYHVHGYLPKDVDYFNTSSEFIFSENSYEHMANKVYRWENMIQADLFSANSNFFIGFSGVDPNFRRLMKQIHDSSEVKNPHYLFMNYGKMIDNWIFEKNKSHLKVKKAFIDAYNTIGEEAICNIVTEAILHIIKAQDDYYYKTLGINILWYDNFCEIANIIHTVWTSMKSE